jgi:hypothetical protein
LLIGKIGPLNLKTLTLQLKHILLLVIGLALQSNVLAQAPENDTSLYQRLKYKPNFQLNNRRSLIDDKLVAFWGFKLGLKLNKYHEVGASFTFMPFKHSFSEQIADSNYKASAKLNFISLYYEPTLLFRNNWEIDVPFFIGAGTVRGRYNNSISDTYAFTKNTNVYMAEASVMTYYKFYKYFSFGLGAGYRKALGSNQVINNNLSASFFLAKIRLEFEAIGQSITKYNIAKRAKKKVR